MDEISKINIEVFLNRIPALKTKHCLDANLVGFYLEKKLSPGEAAKVEEHLNGCIFCLNQLNELMEILVIEKSAEPLLQKDQTRFRSLFQENIKRDSSKIESRIESSIVPRQSIIKNFLTSVSSWNFGLIPAMAMLLVTITSVYFTIKIVNSGDGINAVRLSSKIYHDLMKSGVKVAYLDQSGKKIGEAVGFVINSNGLILTNLNDMIRADSAQVTLNDGISYTVEGVKTDEARSLAFLKISKQNLVPLKGLSNNTLNIGQNIIQIGDSDRPSKSASLATVTNFISSSRKVSSGQQYVQLVNQSASQKKGLLVNQTGEAIGIVISRQENISYAVLLKPQEGQVIQSDFKPVSSIESIRMDTGDSLGYYFKGIMAYDAMEFKKSAELLKMAVDMNTNLDGAHVTLGTLYNDDGKIDQAIKEYEAALEANPKNTDALYYLARAKDQIGKYDEAIRVFEKALQIDPRDKDLLFELGIDYVAQGNNRKAQETYEALRAVDDGNAKKLLRLLEIGHK